MKTKREWEEIWRHFNRLQKRVMASESITTKREFFEEPAQERLDFYQWMQTQCGQYSCYI